MFIRLVLRSKEAISRIVKFHGFFKSNTPFVKALSVSLQPEHHSILEGKEEVFIGLENSIILDIGQFHLKLGPEGFLQTNHEVATKLYETAALWVKELKVKNFLELFSGKGIFSFFCSSFIEKGLGIEINEKAVEDANVNAQRLKLSHLKFIAEDAGKAFALISSFKADLILINPPRRGLCDAIEILIQQAPRHIIYSSCSHLSLKEDLIKLSVLYEVKKIQIFDMFPNSSHFETLVELGIRSTREL